MSEIIEVGQEKPLKPKKRKGAAIALAALKLVAAAIYFVLLLNGFLSLVIPSYYISFGGNGMYPIVSDSMQSQIKPGSIVFARRASSMPLNKDTIIVYKINEASGGVTVVGRIVQLVTDGDRQGYVVKGDNPESEYIVAHENVLGVYTGKSVPFFGYILSFTTSFHGFFCMLMVLLIVLMYVVMSRYIERFDRNYTFKKNILIKSNIIVADMRRKYGDQPEILSLGYALELLAMEPSRYNREEHRQNLEELAALDRLELPEHARVKELPASSVTIIKKKK